MYVIAATYQTIQTCKKTNNQLYNAPFDSTFGYNNKTTYSTYSTRDTAVAAAANNNNV